MNIPKDVHIALKSVLRGIKAQDARADYWGDADIVQAWLDEQDAVRADTDSLREADWPEPVAEGDAPTFEHGIEVGRKRLITDIQNGVWPPELQDA